ncbi:hypothetical protein HHX47_DHR2000762 [Lentinula edodes]|nr:hypothetical protein HHX47_DHR2000762 [Lentinula edodes]
MSSELNQWRQRRRLRWRFLQCMITDILPLFFLCSKCSNAASICEPYILRC